MLCWYLIVTAFPNSFPIQRFIIEIRCIAQWFKKLSWCQIITWNLFGFFSGSWNFCNFGRNFLLRYLLSAFWNVVPLLAIHLVYIVNRCFNITIYFFIYYKNCDVLHLKRTVWWFLESSFLNKFLLIGCLKCNYIIETVLSLYWWYFRRIFVSLKIKLIFNFTLICFNAIKSWLLNSYRL